MCRPVEPRGGVGGQHLHDPHVAGAAVGGQQALQRLLDERESGTGCVGVGIVPV